MKLKKVMEIICDSYDVTEKEILTAIQQGASTVQEVATATGACGIECRDKIQELLDLHGKDVFKNERRYKI